MPLRLQELGDVAGGDRAVERVVLAHLARGHEAQAADPRRERLELGLLLGEPRRVGLLLLVDHGLVGRVDGHGHALRQQEVAAVAVGHLHDVAAAAQRCRRPLSGSLP